MQVLGSPHTHNNIKRRRKSWKGGHESIKMEFLSKFISDSIKFVNWLMQIIK